MTQVLRLLRFAWKIVRNFRRNNGLLLAGALGYNALLSIVPLLALVLVGLSSVLEEGPLISVFETQADAVLPGRAQAVTDAVESFLENRDVIGSVGVVVMLIFSAIAFRMLEEAMATVFRRDRHAAKRNLWLSVLMTVGYLGVFGVGILLLTVVMITLDAAPEHLSFLGLSLRAEEVSTALVKVAAFGGIVAFLTSFYWLMPQVGVKLKRALIGGLVAGSLWEGVRTALMWYFANLSLIDVIYGSLATVIIVLVSLEVAAVIVLLGAEVLAELERAEDEGRAWHAPSRRPSIPPVQASGRVLEDRDSADR